MGDRRRILPIAIVAAFGVLGAVAAACLDTQGLSEPSSADAEPGASDVDTDLADADSDGGNPDGTFADALDAACPAFASFCDDFERGTFANWKTTSSTCGGSIGIVDGSSPPAPFRGSYGVATRITPPDAGCMNGSGVMITQLATTPVPPATLAVRTYVYMATLPAIGFDLLQVHFAGKYVQIIDLAQAEGAWSTYTYNANEVGTAHHATGPLLPTGRWFCLEWDVGFAVGGGHMSLFVDRTPVLDADDDTLGAATQGYDGVDIGVPSGGNTLAPVDIRYDDVAIAVFSGASASAVPRIGCE